MAKKPATAAVIDLWKEHKAVYSPRAGTPELVRAPALKYLMVDGRGDPNTSSGFQAGIGALYGLAYTLKFTFRKEKGVDFRVMPLSGLYHTDDPSAFLKGPKKDWRWTIMIPVPSMVTAAAMKKAKDEVRSKRGDSPSLEAVRLETLREGQCVQLMHVGPYAAERANIEKIHRFIEEKGLSFSGSHHEIYLSDPRRSKPEKMKTIIRQPVKRARSVPLRDNPFYALAELAGADGESLTNADVDETVYGS